MAKNFNQKIEEKLFLNTLPFHFPKEPVAFYFSMQDSAEIRLTKLNHKLFPSNIRDIFPDIANGDTIYTSFDRESEELTPLAIDFSLSHNYFLVKRFYNRQLRHYLNTRNLFVEPNRITKDNQIWLINNSPYEKNRRDDCDLYDRFTLKVDYDHFNNRPQLVLSYDRPSLVYKTSVADILSQNNQDPFAPSEQPNPTANIISRVLYQEERQREDGETFTYRKIDKYSYLAENWDGFNSENAYPIINRHLAKFAGFDDITEEELEEENSQYSSFSTPNRYKKYYNKITFFYKTFLDNKNFRELFPIPDDGFALASTTQIDHTHNSCKELIFGKKSTNFNPQMGVNSGPFENARGSDIQIISISPKKDIDTARSLLRYFRNGYGDNLFAGIKKYTGKDIIYAPKELHLHFEDETNPIPEIEKFLFEAEQNQKLSDNVTYIALYLTPISKYATNKKDRKIYYRVKELLLKFKIVSQAIETDKMIAMLEDDEKYRRSNFAYTLQNMAIATNAKLGGTPWRINTKKQQELIVGVGAFKNIDTNTQYIGSAFSFDNTGSFNSFEYFQKDELKELAGSIKNAIISYSSVNEKPNRLIIHYYKEMSLVKEYPYIDEALQELDCGDIPIYIVTINKTESEDIVLFDALNNDLMPYSGRFVNLGNKTYLLCNNTRYENYYFNSKRESFPFPVKIKIECPRANQQTLDTSVIRELIEQVYQFSRIYWKSIKQQNLPVTIKYPSMIAQMMPHFQNTRLDHIDTKKLWFL